MLFVWECGGHGTFVGSWILPRQICWFMNVATANLLVHECCHGKFVGSWILSWQISWFIILPRQICWFMNVATANWLVHECCHRSTAHELSYGYFSVHEHGYSKFFYSWTRPRKMFLLKTIVFCAFTVWCLSTWVFSPKSNPFLQFGNISNVLALF
jgi:hypothetical protein